MPRNKHPEATRARILEAATCLFLRDGWADTSVQDIVNQLGDVSRGAFYHHFRSKEEIVDQVAGILVDAEALFCVSQDGLQHTGLQKLRELMSRVLGNKRQLELYKTAKEIVQSPVYIGKQAIEYMRVGCPLILRLIEQGNHDGSMDVRDPRQAAESLILLGCLWINPLVFPVPRQQYLRRMRQFKTQFEAVGLPLLNPEFAGMLDSIHQEVSSEKTGF